MVSWLLASGRRETEEEQGGEHLPDQKPDAYAFLKLRFTNKNLSYIELELSLHMTWLLSVMGKGFSWEMQHTTEKHL